MSLRKRKTHGRLYEESARLSELRRRVKSGAYRVQPERVADAMLHHPELIAQVAPTARRD